MSKSSPKDFQIFNHQFWFIMKRLSLGIVLIALTSSILLISDWNRRKPSAKRIPRVAILQYSSQQVLVEGVEGILDGLADNGFIDGQTISLKRYNAEGDVATLNAIASEIKNGQFDMVLTVSTPAMQAVAKANKDGKGIHVFGLVADPFGVGAGISPDNPLDHPEHLVGVPTILPAENSFRLAKKLFPGLKSVGVVWNPGETNSEVTTLQARNVSRELGISLMEANTENSSMVLEAVNSVISRGAEAIWVGGDNTVILALNSVIAEAKKARIPVFTIVPSDPKRGTLFDLGTNFHEAGRLTGKLAAEILSGANPATIPIEDIAPRKLVINMLALNELRDSWGVPKDVIAQADVVVDKTGVHEKKIAVIPKPPEERVFKVGIVYFAPDPGADSCLKGLFDGLKELGFVKDKNLKVSMAHAQGEIANIPPILQNFDNKDLDLIIPMTTPCLTAACSMVKKTPVVFTYVYDPIAAGAGKSPNDHLPNVTGVGSFPPIEDTIEVIEQIVPDARSVGTIYNSSEANSRKVISVAREIFKERGIKLEEVTITSTNEVFQAAQALVTRDVQAFWITGDNTTLQAFEGIAKVATDSRLPLVINDPEFVERGALAAVRIGWYQTGYAAANTVAQVLLGESPGEIPFENVAVKQVVLNHEVAKKVGITLPQKLMKEAGLDNTKGIHQTTTKRDITKPLAKKWRVRLIEFNDVLDVEETEEGVMAGLREAGLVEGRDYEVKVQNAQGDMATVNSLVDAAITEGADLLITLSTPTLQAALQRARGLPIVFTYVASGVAAGAGRSDEDHLPNVTGVYMVGAYDYMMDIIRKNFPYIKKVGTLFVPSEVNSVLHKERLEEAARKVDIEVVAVAAKTSSEVTDAALALCNRGIDAVCQIPGNLTASSFPSIAQAAKKARLPIFAFQSSQAREGAALILGRDYFEVGRESAFLAARVMRGENPALIPFYPITKTRLIINLESSKASGLKIPDSLLKKADEVIGK